MEKIKILNQEFLLDKNGQTIYGSAASLAACLKVDKSLVYRRAVYLRKIGKINDVKKINISAHRITFYYNLDQILLICQEFSKIEASQLIEEMKRVFKEYLLNKKNNNNISIIDELKNIQETLNKVINLLSEEKTDQNKQETSINTKENKIDNVYNINEAAKTLNVNRNYLKNFLLEKGFIYYAKAKAKYAAPRLTATSFGESLNYARDLSKVSKSGETIYQLHITHDGMDYLAKNINYLKSGNKKVDF